MNAQETFIKAILVEINENEKVNTAFNILTFFEYNIRGSIYKEIKNIPYKPYCAVNYFNDCKSVSFDISDVLVPLKNDEISILMSQDSKEIVREIVESYIKVVNEKLQELGLVRILSKILIKEEQ